MLLLTFQNRTCYFARFTEPPTPKLMTLEKERNLIKDGDGTIQSMHLLKETLQSLMMLPAWELESALPISLTKDKKEKLKNEN